MDTTSFSPRSTIIPDSLQDSIRYLYLSTTKNDTSILLLSSSPIISASRHNLTMNNDYERFYPVATLPFENPDWEQMKPSYVKGETKRLVEHCQRVNRDKHDTSVDTPWWVHRNWSLSDAYTILIAAIFVPPMFLLWPLLFVCCIPPVLVNLWYICDLPEGCEMVPRGTLEWKLHCAGQFVLSFPVQLLAMILLLYSHIIFTVFGSLYLFVGSFVRCKSPFDRLSQNLDVVAPYQHGPNLYWNFEDCVAAVAGSVYRQGLCEFTASFATMFIINPWIKYWVTGNIYLEDLGERFITQIGQPLNDMETYDVDTNFIKGISQAKLSTKDRTELDKKFFAPHYPFPDKRRRFAIGMQFASFTTTFVHTTHFRTPEIFQEGQVAALSNSCLLPVYRVVLWRNNPYHIYTGIVEANHSTGFPTQREKCTGIEHPMWLVNSHNKLAADRKVPLFSVGQIDTFFDEFIPQLSHFIRLNVLGREVADAAYEKDPKKGYEADQYQSMAEI